MQNVKVRDLHPGDEIFHHGKHFGTVLYVETTRSGKTVVSYRRDEVERTISLLADGILRVDRGGSAR